MLSCIQEEEGGGFGAGGRRHSWGMDSIYYVECFNLFGWDIKWEWGVVEKQ